MMLHCLVVKVTWLISHISMSNQEHKNEHAKQVGPDVDSFVVQHEQAFKKFTVGGEANSVATFDQRIV